MKEKNRRIAATLEENVEIRAAIRTVCIYAVVFICGFLTSLGNIFSGLSPFGAAFALSVPLSYSPAAAGGAILGYVLTESSEQTVRYAAAVIIGSVLLLTAHRLIGRRFKRVVVAGITGVCIAATGTAVALGMGADAYTIVLSLAEGLCGACFCYFFSVTASCLAEIKSRRVLKTAELVSLMMSASAFLASIEGIAAFPFSLARAVACFIVLICALYGGGSAGVTTGVCLGAVLSLSEGGAFTASAFALGGLFAGAAGLYGRFGSAVAFLCADCAVTLFSGKVDALPYAVLEAGLASLALLLLPKKAGAFFSSFFVRSGVSDAADHMRDLLSFKLHAASTTVSEVSASVRAVSKALTGIAKRNETTLYADVRDEVCRKCSRMTNCWEYNFENTLDAFNRMILSRKNGDRPTRDNLPSYFSSRCVCVESLTECFNRLYTRRSFKEAEENRVAEVRRVAADQFISISVMLENLADELQRDIVFAPETADKAREALEGIGLHVVRALCVINESGYATLQVFCTPVGGKLSPQALADAVSDAVGIDFAPPVVGDGGAEHTLLLFCEKPPCAVRAAVSQYIGEGQSVCGDACDTFADGRGHYIMILSDGMGTGSRAAVDGAMTTGLAGKLIRAGFGFDCVVKTVNSALMVKSKDESLSTLDIVSIDLFKGEATFYKAGAAASLICRRGKTIRIERSSLPLGILRDVEFERVTGKLGDGDILLMMSDGAASIPQDALRKEIAACADKSPQEIAAAVAALAKNSSANGRTDDITVMAAVIRRLE